MTDFRKLCQDLLDELQYQTNWSTLIRAEDLQERAHAALAEPEPEEPTDEELMKLAREWNSGYASIELEFIADYARAVLARWGK